MKHTHTVVRMKRNSCLVDSTLLGSGTAEGVDGTDDVCALVAGLTHVDQGVHLAEGVVVASQIEALGIVGLDSWEVAIEVGQLVLGVQDGLGDLGILGNVSDDIMGDAGQDLTPGKEVVELSNGVELGLACGGLLNLLLKNVPGNLKFEI